MHHGYVSSCCRPSGVTRIGGFSIRGLDYVVSSVEGLIAYELYLYRTVAKTLDCENSHVLKLVPAHRYPEYDGVIITVGVVVDRYIIDVIIAVKIKVVDP